MEGEGRIGLVLGGGGARGYAHIGVLRALREEGLEAGAVAACSIGGVVGALHASGHQPDEIHRIMKEVSFARLLDFGTAGSILGAGGIEKALEPHLPETFEELRIPLAVTAVDLQRGNLVVLRRGPLLHAMLATIAIPGILPPQAHDDALLVDGGLLNNLPVDIIRTLTDLPVLAVDVSARADRRLDFESGQSFWERIKRPFERGHRPLVLDVLMKAFLIPQSTITETRLALHPPDRLLRPCLDPGLRLEDFHRMEEAVEVGYEAAKDMLKD